MPASRRKRVAVIGATGLVGRTIAEVLRERGFPVGDYVPVATEASGGREIEAFGLSFSVRRIDEFDFDGIDYCFFTAGAEVSREFVPRAVENGCRVIDNTTAFRMEREVPLVVPEINGKLVEAGTKLVSCPNCTTIILVLTLAPLIRAIPVTRVVVTSFQSVSGAGREALNEMIEGSEAVLGGTTWKNTVFSKPIAFNCLPQIGEIDSAGYSEEEKKIVEETRKILSKPELRVIPTAVRVPVRVGHAMSVYVEFGKPVSLDQIRSLLERASGVTVGDDIPTPLDVAGTDHVMVGRLKMGGTRPDAVSYWAVGDNLRKGAATNSVQIAELLSLEY